MVEGLASAGADIIGVSASLKENSEVAQIVQKLGRNFTAYQCDLSDRSALDSLLQTLNNNHNIDILVNNAGIIRRAPALHHGDEIWDEVIETNLTAPFILARDIGRSMIERQKGKIIFTASVLSFQGGLYVPSYAATKGAIAQITKSLSNEWAGQGVNVNAIAPGYIVTDNTEAIRKDPDRSRKLIERIPAGRFGAPEDLIGASVFLASGASDYVNGTVLTVDGGWLGN